jgi:hypothetical protein
MADQANVLAGEFSQQRQPQRVQRGGGAKHWLVQVVDKPVSIYDVPGVTIRDKCIVLSKVAIDPSAGQGNHAEE